MSQKVLFVRYFGVDIGRSFFKSNNITYIILCNLGSLSCVVHYTSSINNFTFLLKTISPFFLVWSISRIWVLIVKQMTMSSPGPHWRSQRSKKSPNLLFYSHLCWKKTECMVNDLYYNYEFMALGTGSHSLC